MKEKCKIILVLILSCCTTLIPLFYLTDLRTLHLRINIFEGIYFVLGNIVWMLIVTPFFVWLLVD